MKTIMSSNVVAGDKVYTIKLHPSFDSLSNGNLVGHKRLYCEEFGTFDIETSTLNKNLNIMYLWQFCFCGKFVILGRTWDEYRELIRQLSLCIPENVKYVVYVHNLSYEYQYIRGVHNFGKDDVFLLDSRKPAKATIPGCNIEYRCSYKLSNRSLDDWGKQLGVAHRKLSGDEFDYSKKRFSSTPLSKMEIRYGVNDVCGLWECVKQLCINEGRNMATIPLTSTGFVRQECRKILREYEAEIKPLIPLEDVLELALEAMRGGDTHCNRYYSCILLSKVWCYDISSSYPYTMVTQMFPVAPFEKKEMTVEKVMRLCKSRTTPMLMRLRLTNVRLKNILWGFPYIARYKARKVKGAVYDNGRVLEADSLEVSVTDIDMKIMMEQYLFDVEVLDVYTSRYGLLPPKYRKHIIKYYEDKTALKGVSGCEVEYEKSKNRINSIYGMTVQNPIKPRYEYIDGDYVESENIDEQIEDYLNRGWLPYQWGVWVTAHARQKLQEALQILGDDAVYCDTDSVFFLGNPTRLEELNAERNERAISMGASARDKKGKLHVMGVFEQDKFCDRFISAGAKKYVYESGGELHITIAGVGKIKGGEELRKLGGICAFTPGLIFHEAAGSCWYYNDTPTHWEEYEGKRLEVTPNISALPTTYEVSLSADYATLLQDLIFSRSHSTKK